MPSAKRSDFPDDAPHALRRAPVAVAGLPVSAPSAEPDPTLEIRQLIGQLQQSAREARAQLQRAEAERDALGRQLEQAVHEAEELRARESDQRNQFTEITTIIRERDLATAEADRSARAALRAQEQTTAASRERDELRRQRDEAQQRLEGLTRAYSESGMRVNELQKQGNTIRQARDAAHAQNTDLTTRLAALEDEIAELTYQHDQARRTQQQAEQAAAVDKTELEQLREGRGTDAARIEELTAQLDTQRKKFLDLAEQKSAITQAGTEHAIALAEARSQVASLTQERDTARLLTQAQSLEFEKLRSEFHTYRELGTRAATDELNTLRERLAALESQARDSRQEAADARQQNLALAEKLDSLSVVADDATAHQEESELQLLTLSEQHEATCVELQNTRGLIEELSAAKEASETQAEEQRLEAEAQLAALRAQAAVLGESDDAGPSRREVQQRFEKQRLQTLELAAQLGNAQRNIRELSASLAEARLQVKFALAPRPAPGPRPPVVPIAAGVVTRSSAAEALGELVPSLLESFEVYASTPGENAALLQLHDRVITYAARARVSDCIALYRLAHVFASLLESLAAAPGQVNTSTLHTIRQAVEFFVFLREEPKPERFTDPARARVLMVDDDEGNCQCVQIVMQEQMIQTSVSFDPTSALLELASDPFDLVMLDVNMPDMNGFELCKRLRELPLHAQTPVVFLTGLATEERREQSILAGGNDFLGKPFNLHELTVKALLLIIQKQVAASPGGSAA